MVHSRDFLSIKGQCFILTTDLNSYFATGEPCYVLMKGNLFNFNESYWYIFNLTNLLAIKSCLWIIFFKGYLTLIPLNTFARY